MRWYTHISRINEGRENFKEGFEHEYKRQMTKRKTEITVGTIG
jgi:hypothetical protein